MKGLLSEQDPDRAVLVLRRVLDAVADPDRLDLGPVGAPEHADRAVLRVLLDNMAGFRARKVKEEDVHVWWGKVRSKNRLEQLPHLPEILAMDAELADQGESGRELHLYLTDYRSLYVGHVYEITADNVTADEADHVPAYYRERRLHCDCWFRLGDIRRLILDDTVV